MEEKLVERLMNLDWINYVYRCKIQRVNVSEEGLAISLASDSRSWINDQTSIINDIVNLTTLDTIVTCHCVYTNGKKNETESNRIYIDSLKKKKNRSEQQRK